MDYLNIKSDGNPPPRTRRKLQKGASRQRHQWGECDNTRPSTSSAQARPTVPPIPPDLSDSKWLEYVRRSGFLYSNVGPPLPSRDALPIPELSHVVTSSIDNGNSTESEQSSSSKSASRRRAKTPVFAVGQLEETEKRRSCVADSPGDSSAELGIIFPHSDDGTLVSFEEETIYFKPMSFSLEPTPPPLNISRSADQNQQHERQAGPLSSPPGNLSLQICIHLLTRELAAAMSERPYRQLPDTSALQIWVMIEAYERLKSRLLDMSMAGHEAQPLQMMFDVWLRSLYAIHNSLTGDSSRPKEDDYDGLEETLD